MLQDILEGKLELMFLNGLSMTTNIVRVMWTVEGIPILLIDDLGRCFNWGTIVYTKEAK